MILTELMGVYRRMTSGYSFKIPFMWLCLHQLVNLKSALIQTFRDGFSYVADQALAQHGW